jgi:hypothetical protein
MSLRPDFKRAIDEYLAIEKEKWQTQVRDEIKHQHEHYERLRRSTVGLGAFSVIAFCAFVYTTTRNQIDLAVQARVAAAVESHQAMINERARRADATLDEMAVSIGKTTRRYDELGERIAQIDSDIHEAGRNAKLLSKHDVDLAIRALDSLQKFPEAAAFARQLAELDIRQAAISRQLTGMESIPRLNVERIVIGNDRQRRIVLSASDAECSVALGTNDSEPEIWIGTKAGESRLRILDKDTGTTLTAVVQNQMAGVGVAKSDQFSIMATTEAGPVFAAVQQGDFSLPIPEIPARTVGAFSSSLSVDNCSLLTTTGLLSRWKGVGAMSLGAIPGESTGFHLWDDSRKGLFNFSHGRSVTYAEFSRPGAESFLWSSGLGQPGLSQSGLTLRDSNGEPKVVLAASRDGGWLSTHRDLDSYFRMSWWNESPVLSITDHGEPRAVIGRDRIGRYGIQFPNSETRFSKSE